MSRIKSLPGESYRIELVDENTRRRFSLRLTRGQAIGLGCGVFILIILIGGLLTSITPLRRIMPKNTESDLRSEYIALYLKIDSLSAESKRNSAYANTLLTAIGAVEATDTRENANQTLLEALPPDSLLQASDRERNFSEQFKENQQFKLSVLSPIAAEGMVFYTPVRDALVSRDKADAAGIKLATIGTTPVSAVYRGTVMSCTFDNSGYQVIIQHPSDFISIYLGLTDVFVKKGVKIDAGTRIGMANTARYPLYFELWHSGTPVKPENHIKF